MADDTLRYRHFAACPALQISALFSFVCITVRSILSQMAQNARFVASKIGANYSTPLFTSLNFDEYSCYAMLNNAIG